MGKAIIFSAPSGAGKTTIVQYLIRKDLNLAFSISATTRAQRPAEKNNRDYYFLDVTSFKSKISSKEFIEWEEVYKDHFYGTLIAEVERLWEKGKHVIFDVDVVGGLNLKKYFGDKALSIFVMPPSIKELEERLFKRHTETPDSIQRRIAKAGVEIKYANKFDYILNNFNLPDAFKEAETIVGNFLDK